MRKLLTVLCLVLMCAIAPTVKAAEKDYQVRFEVYDKDPEDTIVLSGEQVLVYVKDIDNDTTYRFPVPLGEGGYIGYFPLPKGRYEFIAEPGAKPGDIIYIGENFKVTEDEPNNQANAYMSTLSEDATVPTMTPVEKTEAEPVPTEEPSGFAKISVQGKITSIISIIIVVVLIVFYLYKHFSRRDDE